VGCLCVALKWLAPHEPVLPSHPGLGLQNSHLPLLFVLSSSLAWALGLDGFATDTCFVVMGTYVGWWYLRFVHRSPTASSAVAAGSSSSSGSNTGFGDNSDEFALMTLFPPGLRKYLSPIADFSYGVCVLLGFFKDRKVGIYRNGIYRKTRALGFFFLIIEALTETQKCMPKRSLAICVSLTFA